MHHIFVKENSIDTSAGFITIDKATDFDDFNHLVNVLRVNVGEEVLCSAIPFDMTFDYRCIVKNITKDSMTFEIVEKTVPHELPIKINLYQGITKGDKFEFIVEKAVELGVYSVTPVAMKYSIAKLDEKKALTKIERYNKIAKSAAEQSKRHIIPEVQNPITYNQMIEELSDRFKNRDEDNGDRVVNIVFYENANGLKDTRDTIRMNIADDIRGIDKPNVEFNVVIGPEGGFSDDEIEKAKVAGYHILSLGNRILRTETAAVVALSMLMYEVDR